jgi:hypothetical protein
VRDDSLAIVDGKLSLRRLGERDAQESGGPSKANPVEGCIIKICHWRRLEVLAEPMSNVERVLVLDDKRFNERKGEKRLVREQGRDEANQPHIIREAKRPIGDGTPCGGCAGAAFYVPTRQRLHRALKRAHRASVSGRRRLIRTHGWSDRHQLVVKLKLGADSSRQ